MRESRILFRTSVNNYVSSEEFSKLAKSTARGYVDAAKILVRHFATVKIKDISHEDLTFFLKYYMDELTPFGKNGYSKSTRKNVKSVFKQIYDYHVEKKLIKRKIDFSSIKVTYGTARVPRVPYDKKTIDELRNAIESRHDSSVFDLFELGTCTGMRVQELLGLSDSDLTEFSDGEYAICIERAVVERQVKSTKNQESERNLYLSEKAKNIVFKHIDDKQALNITTAALMGDGRRALFINYKNKKPWTSSSEYYNELALLFKKAGLEKNYRGLHPTRHTFATNAKIVGMREDLISEYLGHSNTQTMKKHYIHKKSIVVGRMSKEPLNSLG